MPNFIVRRMKDGSEVSRIKVTTLTERHVEKALMGLMRNMNLDDYWVDTEEVDKALAKKAKAK